MTRDERWKGRGHSVYARRALGTVLLTLFPLMTAQDRGAVVRAKSQDTGRGAARVALVIGNNAYRDAPLQNAVNDARAMDAVLREVGFDVQTVTDAPLAALDRAIDGLADRLGKGDVSVFYFAGHGIQIDGKNYLIPIDFAAETERDAKRAAVDVDEIHDRLSQKGVSVNLLVLDACRNNPFKGSRATGGGLAEMKSAEGSYIAFATAPGRTASDSPGSSNGLFTKHLVRVLRQPGLTVDQVFTRVRHAVREESAGAQLPWSASSLLGELVFKPGEAVSGADGQAGENPDRARLRDMDDWQAARRSGKLESFLAYLDAHPEGAFRAEAEAAVAKARAESAEGRRQARSVRLEVEDPPLKQILKETLEQPFRSAGISVVTAGVPARFVLKIVVESRKSGPGQAPLPFACDTALRWTLSDGQAEAGSESVFDRAAGGSPDAACEQALRKGLTRISQTAGRRVLAN